MTNQGKGPLKHYRKKFFQLRDERDKILADDKLDPIGKYEKSQAIQSKINDLAKKIEKVI